MSLFELYAEDNSWFYNNKTNQDNTTLILKTINSYVSLSSTRHPTPLSGTCFP